MKKEIPINTEFNPEVAEEIVDMNFKVSYDFKKKFKTMAIEEDKTMKQLLEDCFRTYFEVHKKKHEGHD